MTSEPPSSIVFARGQLPRQPGRHQHPAQPHARRQPLARRADVDDLLGRQPLQRADGDAVVAVLGVVVVLDDQPLAPRPTRSARRVARVPARRRRELVGGGDDHGGGVGLDRAPRRAARCSSTGIGTTSMPAFSTISRWTCQPGSSSATRSTPRSRSTRQISAKPCMKPVHTSVCSGSASRSADAPEVARQSASRSSGAPRGSP